MHFDLTLFTLLHQFAGRSRLLDGAGFFAADTLTYLLVAGLAAFALSVPGARRKAFAAAEMLFAFLIARGLAATLIQYFFFRERPFNALHFTPLLQPNTLAAFPSGHMAGLFAVSFVLYKFDRRWGWLYFILSFLVGAGRVFAGVHWPSDILGGILVGLAGGWSADRLVRKERQELFPRGSQPN